MSDKSGKVAGRRFLIVNADDFGLTRGVNEGIIRAHKSGIVTSATILVGLRASGNAIELARENELLSTGVHLSCGSLFQYPASSPYGLPPESAGISVDEVFFLMLRSTTSKKYREKLLDSFRYQVEWALKRGLSISHLDTHKHIHAWPPAASLVCRVANEFGIPAVRFPYEPFLERGPVNLKTRLFLLLLFVPSIIIRKILEDHGLRFPDNFRGVLSTGRWTKRGFLRLLKTLPVGVTEIMVHPGYTRGLSKSYTRLISSRETELDILADPNLKTWCFEHHIQLINYRYFQN